MTTTSIHSKYNSSLNVNTDLFKRFAPKRKIDIINSMTQSQLMAITLPTLERIIKEVGVKFIKTRDKRLYISRDLRTGNDWNSDVTGVEFVGGQCYFNIYVQSLDTDTDVCEKAGTFLSTGNYHGKCYFANRHGDDVPTYFTYTMDKKAEVVRSILLQYVYDKYADKLKDKKVALIN